MAMSISGKQLGAWVLVLGMVCAGSASAADAAHKHHDGHQMDTATTDHAGHGKHTAASGHGDHSAHQAMMNKTRYARSSGHYHFPDAPLLNQRGEKVTLNEVLANDKPVVLNFIFTTCTTICPVMTATFSRFDHLLSDEEKAAVRMVSISIDPEQDRPAALGKYAEKFAAGDNWTFLTGDLDDIIKVLKSFDAYRGNKMNHEPVTLLRQAGAMEWVRLEGLTSAKDLVGEYRLLTAGEEGHHKGHHAMH